CNLVRARPTYPFILKQVLSLFFDQVALLVPDYMQDRPARIDPAITAGLENAGILTLLSPEKLVDQAATEKLASALTDVIASGVLDSLPHDGRFAELSMSRLGFGGDAELAAMIFEELHSRGLAKDSEDGVSVPLHATVRNLVLVLLSQILREAGSSHGLSLHPVTDRLDVHTALGDIVGVSSPAGRNDIITADLEFVAPDLSAVPVDEMLDFRRQHGDHYRAYSRALRDLTRDLEKEDPDVRASMIANRKEALSDAADDLRRRSRREFVTRVSLGIGILAGVAGALEGSVVSGAIAAASSTGALAVSARAQVPDPHSYLFAMKREFV
ncbi:MAG: hypothetical protein ITG02_01025, partial [Patulibacter sp.]|nr:hypothetical protein [Patulibacter sp.]